MSSIPTLATERLILRPITQDDVDAFLAIMGKAEIMRYFPNPAPMVLERVLRYVNGQIGHWQKYGLGHWAVVLRGSDTLIGWCGLQYLAETDETEVAYCFDQPYWGKGFATEAAQASLDYGFKTAGLKSIVGLTHTQNTASQNVLKKIGLQYVGDYDYFGMLCCKFVLSR